MRNDIILLGPWRQGRKEEPRLIFPLCRSPFPRKHLLSSAAKEQEAEISPDNGNISCDDEAAPPWSLFPFWLPESMFKVKQSWGRQWKSSPFAQVYNRVMIIRTPQMLFLSGLCLCHQFEHVCTMWILFSDVYLFASLFFARSNACLTRNLPTFSFVLLPPKLAHDEYIS